eukprot:6535043-Lingulodinium_polyedra.AAC.1
MRIASLPAPPRNNRPSVGFMHTSYHYPLAGGRSSLPALLSSPGPAGHSIDVIIFSAQDYGPTSVQSEL